MYATEGIQMENYVTSMDENDNQQNDAAASKEQERASPEGSKHEQLPVGNEQTEQ